MRDNVMVLFCICELKFLIYDINQFATYQCILHKQCKVSCYERLVQFYTIPKQHDYVSLKIKKKDYFYSFIYLFTKRELTAYFFQILNFKTFIA